MFDGVFANPLHWGILLVIVLIIFGPGKLPGVGSALGQSLREFKKASNEDAPKPPASATAQSAAAALAPSVAMIDGPACGACGRVNQADARFCSDCAAPMASDAENSEHAENNEALKPAVAGGPIVCSLCQTENHASSRFCAHCGRPIEPAVEHV